MNKLFCDVVTRTARPGDSVWVHDYHLVLLPVLLRRRVKGNPWYGGAYRG